MEVKEERQIRQKINLLREVVACILSRETELRKRLSPVLSYGSVDQNIAENKERKSECELAEELYSIYQEINGLNSRLSDMLVVLEL